jgi:tetratricopeptide (TPR) repeat protein
LILEFLTHSLLSGVRFFAEESDLQLSRWRTASEMGHRAFGEGRYADAEGEYRTALAEARQAGKKDLRLSEALNDLGEACRVRGKLDEAEQLFREALEIREAELGSDDLSVAQTLNNLAAVYSAKGEFEPAASLYRQAIDVEEYSLGREHPVVATSLNNLALVYRMQGEHAQALPLLIRALRIGINATGPEHPNVGTCFNNIASVCFAAALVPASEAFFKQALAIKQKTLGPLHPEVAVILENLGELSLTQGRESEAEGLFLRAQAIDTIASGAELPAGVSGEDLARIASEGPLAGLEIADLSATLSAVSDAILEERPPAPVEEQSAAPPEEPSPGKKEHRPLARLAQEEPEPPPAEPLIAQPPVAEQPAPAQTPTTAPLGRSWARAMELDAADASDVSPRPAEVDRRPPPGPRPAPEPEREEGGTHRISGASAFDDGGAEGRIRSWIAARESELGESDPQLLPGLNRLGLLQLLLGRYAEAEPVYRRILSIKEKASGRNHHGLIPTLQRLAGVYSEQARVGDA